MTRQSTVPIATLHQHTHRSMASQSGSSLLEVLISVVVLSLGSLGVAGLQVTSKHATNDAHQRLLATYLANDIIERMRNNPSALATYAGEAVGGNTIASEPSPDCSTSSQCNAAQLAQHDRWAWEQAIDGVTIQSGSNKAGGVLKPKGCISNNNGNVQVTVSWHGLNVLSDAGGTANGDANCGAVSAHRRQVVIKTFIN
jgi:type IV pilus assembly protein PilV